MMRGFKFFAFFLMAIAIEAHVSAQSTDNWTKKKAEKWFNSGSWMNDLKLKAHESTDKVEFAKQYHKNKDLWDKAFAYLSNPDLENIAPGKYEIDGDNVFATVTENPTKEMKDVKYEAHKKYTDIQYVIKGKEKMAVCPISMATVSSPYNDKKDAALYISEKGKFYVAEPGVFFIFFSQDGHCSNLKVPGFDSDKKIVIKVRMTE